MSAASPFTTLAHARHLLRRTGFGATKDDAETLLKKYTTRGAVADALLEFKPSRFKPGGRYIDNIHNKWVKYMIGTKRPLQEKLVLFWHDHFATSYDKVGDVRRMAFQNRLLRENCKGNFKAFVKAINKDPAMMDFLDTSRNHKEEPNENYSRELQELFTLGVKDPLGNPNYDQEDIVQIARAFSGWDYDKEAALNEDDHDKGDAIEGWETPRGPKVIYKNRGGFNDVNGQSFDTGANYAGEIDRVIDIIFKHRYGPSGSERSTVADYIGRKLVSYFAHPDPDPTFVQQVVDQSGFATSWELTPLLKAIFVHDNFYLSALAPGAGTKKSVKWPIDFVVGSLRMLGMKLKSKYQYVDGGSGNSIADQLTNMGQVLFQPPSVFGWDWETAWLSSSSTLLARYAFARDLTSARNSTRKSSFRADKLFNLALTDPTAIVNAVTELLGVDGQLSAAERDALIAYVTDGAGPTAKVFLTDDLVRNRKLNGLVATVMQSPVYQLH